MSNIADIEDELTNEVIDYITLEKIIFIPGKLKTRRDFIYHQIKCFQLVSLLPNFKR